jgi:hypothetical protein
MKTWTDHKKAKHKGSSRESVHDEESLRRRVDRRAQNSLIDADEPQNKIHRIGFGPNNMWSRHRRSGHIDRSITRRVNREEGQRDASQWAQSIPILDRGPTLSHSIERRGLYSIIIPNGFTKPRSGSNYDTNHQVVSGDDHIQKRTVRLLFLGTNTAI